MKTFKLFIIFLALPFTFLSAQNTFLKLYKALGWYPGGEAYCAKETDDGGFIVIGNIYHFANWAYDFLMVKTDSLGDTLWTRIYGSTEFETGRDLLLTNDGGFFSGQ